MVKKDIDLEVFSLREKLQPPMVGADRYVVKKDIDLEVFSLREKLQPPMVGADRCVRPCNEIARGQGR